jgi:hypothetical protein
VFLEQVILGAVLYGLPGLFFCSSVTQDQDRHTGLSLKELIERPDTFAIGQVQIKHYRPHPSVTQSLNPTRKFGNPLHLEPLFRYGT